MAMFAATILDVWTTWALVSRNYGVELNPTLAPMIRHSLIWIPIYLLCHPLLVRLLPEMSRFGFGVYFAFAGLLFGLNNLAGILYGRYFLIETFGFPASQGICMSFGIAVFIWKLRGHASNAQEKKRHVMTALCWIGIFVLLELVFLAASRLA
jgi:hypothetical protein